MRYFGHLTGDRRRALFSREPEPFGPFSPAPVLSLALGATLYCPADRPALARDVLRCAALGATSIALCLEDAVSAADVLRGEANVVAALQELHRSGAPTPLLFVRVRHGEQIPDLTTRAGAAAEMLTGFILPKITSLTGPGLLEAVVDAAQSTGLPLYAMPVLESPEIIHRERRVEALLETTRLLGKFRSHVLAVRLGATDLCGLYGIRRSRTMSVYDVKIVADVISDVVNVLGRADEAFRITGPVWEYFERGGSGPDRALPRALMREVELDRANGLSGKTVIHPSHLAVVHGMSVVGYEDHLDACDVVSRGDADGAFASVARDKMNESGPHQRWAHDVLDRAAVFGVARPGVGPDELVRGVRDLPG